MTAHATTTNGASSASDSPSPNTLHAAAISALTSTLVQYQRTCVRLRTASALTPTVATSCPTYAGSAALVHASQTATMEASEQTSAIQPGTSRARCSDTSDAPATPIASRLISRRGASGSLAQG